MAIGEFTLLQWSLMLAIGLFSGLVHGFVGIGFPLVATPLFSLLFGFRQAIPLLVLPTLLMVVCTMTAFGRSLPPRDALRLYWPLLPTLPIGIYIGTRALFALDADALSLLLAAVVAIFLYLDRHGRSQVPLMQRHPTVFSVPFGLAGGICEGAVNVSGPMLLIFFLMLDLEAGAIIAVMSYLFLLGKVVQAAELGRIGALDAAVWQAALPLCATGAAMFFLGLRLRRRFDAARYRGWLKGTLALMVMLLVLRVVTPG